MSGAGALPVTAPGGPDRPAAEDGCQLFLISPPSPATDTFAAELDRALATGPVAGFLLRPPPAALAAPLARALQPVCARHQVAFLIENDLDLVLALGADGLHLRGQDEDELEAAVARARQRLGAERILGAGAGRSRHAAMTAGDAGADYVAFGEAGRGLDGELQELLGWWQELFLLPCLADAALAPEALAAAARSGADLVAAGDWLWQADGAARAHAALAAATGR